MTHIFVIESIKTLSDLFQCVLKNWKILSSQNDNFKTFFFVLNIIDALSTSKIDLVFDIFGSCSMFPTR